MLVLPVVGLLTRGAAVVHVKAGALENGTRCTALAAHVVQGWGWLATSRHLLCDTLGRREPLQMCSVSALLCRRFHLINSITELLAELKVAPTNCYGNVPA